ncbi:CD302 antigen [Lissotriton helveticus]
MKSDVCLFQIVSVFLILDSIRAGGKDECPSSMWIQFRGGCYTLLPAALTNTFGIDKARELCKVSGADVISINNEEENKFITETFQKEWQGPEEVFLGIFFDTDDNSFKWFDKSEVTFTNWTEEDVSEELLNTCAALHTQSGGWRKMSCESFTEMRTLCKATLYPKRKTGASHETILTMSLVIVFSMLISIAIIIIWTQCKRRALLSRLSSTTYQPANIVPFNDESVLVDAEEREFRA